MTDERDAVIAIIDDEPQVVAAIHRGLGEHSNRRYLCFTDPLEAVEALAVEQVDVILSDIDMPTISGHELMIRARLLRPCAVRIFVTAVTQATSAITAINEGEVHRYIVKPFDLEYLRSVVEGALARKQELDVVAAAEQRAALRRLLYDQLRTQHPGIDDIERDDDGVYVLDPAAGVVEWTTR